MFVATDRTATVSSFVVRCTSSATTDVVDGGETITLVSVSG